MHYAGISECDVLNGEGFRVVLFVSGCSHHCFKCQNRLTWNPKYGHEYTNETEKYIMTCLGKDYIDGITITGGDPFYEGNLNNVCDLIARIKCEYPNKNIWVYTGYTLEELLERIAHKSDLDTDILYYILYHINVLVDGRYDDSQRDLNCPWAGSRNQRVIDMQKSLKERKVVLWRS